MEERDDEPCQARRTKIGFACDSLMISRIIDLLFWICSTLTAAMTRVVDTRPTRIECPGRRKPNGVPTDTPVRV